MLCRFVPRQSDQHFGDLRFLPYLFHVLDLDAETRLLSAVGHPGFLGLCGAEFLELGNDIFGGHLLFPSSCK